MAKAMIKQIDRVIGDLIRQTKQFRKTGRNPITVACVGINYSQNYTSYEGECPFPTNGAKYKHPFHEADDARNRILQNAAPAVDEFLLLPFRATNTPPSPFEWVDYRITEMEYGTFLVRVSREYDKRFQ